VFDKGERAFALHPLACLFGGDVVAMLDGIAGLPACFVRDAAEKRVIFLDRLLARRA
jgi:hypothetical protein